MISSKNLLNCGRTETIGIPLPLTLNSVLVIFGITRMIRIAGKTIFYKHWANAGVMKINDLMTNDSRIISYSCFKDKFCFPVSFLEFSGVTSAISSAMRSLKLTLPDKKILENVLLKLNSSNNQVKQLTKSSSPKSVLARKKAKRNGLETVNTSMWKIWTGSQFIYYLGYVH